ncbi:hypothetical protein [Microbulbifer sp. YPW16]|uniref:hypothetical protein n=1 Tax=unclassified Microbulbifer TaxID=2619833 RepID=UPI001E356576|nr:hypothetical protein [Microbulbifer sp. YPW16]UHQ57031.1 hypothetical protein LVE68_08645 [Microbulbifer sp. YPW16]
MKKIRQRKFLQGSREVEILDKSRVRVKYRTLRASKEETFNLFDLDTKYDRYMQRPYRYLVLSVILFALGIFILAKDTTPNDLTGEYIALFSVLFPASMFLAAFFYKTVNLVIVKNRHNGAPAIILWQNSPSREACENFLESLETEIDKLKLNPEASPEQKILACKQALELLLSTDALSGEEANEIFDRVKKSFSTKKKAQLYTVS